MPLAMLFARTESNKADSTFLKSVFFNELEMVLLSQKFKFSNSLKEILSISRENILRAKIDMKYYLHINICLPRILMNAIQIKLHL